jgi:hypothetical protein
MKIRATCRVTRSTALEIRRDSPSAAFLFEAWDGRLRSFTRRGRDRNARQDGAGPMNLVNMG